MKTKFNGILTLLLAFMVQITFAQEKTISGVVSDDMGPVSDITVKVRGTDNGTATDFDGNYTIKAKTGDVIDFTHISYGSMEKVVGASNTIDVLMSTTGTSLDEVIISTGLGKKVKAKDDLTSATIVNKKLLERSGEAGIIQALAGKTSGVNITKNSGDPGTGAFIQIRGANSILGSNVPLIVLDGVLISNSNPGSETSGVQQQSRLNDIPTDDIKSLVVLKGTAAAVLYGSAAASGVLVITTKSGSARGDKKWNVNYKSSTYLDVINEEWDLQSEYGQGIGGNYNDSNRNSWGDKISSRAGGLDDVTVGFERFEAEDGTVYYPITTKNSTDTFGESNRDAIFGNGFTSENSISLGYAGEDSNTFLSFSNWNQTGIIKNGSNYERTTFRVNQKTNFNDKLEARVNATYISSDADAIQNGSNLNGLYLGYLRNPVDFDIRDYKGTSYFVTAFPDLAETAVLNAQRSYRTKYGPTAIYNNPLWTINEQQNKANLSRFIVSPQLTYKFNDNLSLTGKYGVDSYRNRRRTFFPVNSGPDVGTSEGYFNLNDGNRINQHYNIHLNGNSKVSEKFNLNWLVGYELRVNQFQGFGGTNNKFVNPFADFADLQNVGGNSTAEDQTVSSLSSYDKIHGAYINVAGEVFNQILFSVSYRGDRSSTLPDEIFYYPGFSLGWKFNELLGDNSTLNFGKIRLSYGEVGVAPVAYVRDTGFQIGQTGSSWGDALSSANFGGTFEQALIRGNPNIKIERVKELEYGADLQFFKNRIGLGVTVYDRTTEDVLTRVDLPASTGFTSEIANINEISNKGVEVDLKFKVIRNQDFKWNINLNYSKNTSLVTGSGEGETITSLAGFTGTASDVVDGHPFAVLQGGAYARDEFGNKIFDANGFPTLDATGNKVIGDPNADWRGGVNTDLSFKGFRISALVEAVQGQDAWNGTRGVLNGFGVTAETGSDVTVSAADAATIVNANGDTIDSLPSAIFDATNNTYTLRGNLYDFGAGTVLRDQAWYQDGLGNGFNGLSEQNIVDASFVKLREVTVGYSLPKSLIQNIGLTNVDFSISGRNLITWTDVEGFDPESNLTGASAGRGLEYFTNPSTKSYVFTFKIGF